MELQHEDITGEIIGAAFEVYNVLGYGFLEKVYQRAMQVETSSPRLYGRDGSRNSRDLQRG